MRASRFALVCGTLALAVACTDAPTRDPLGPSPDPRFLISDAVHDGGNEHFFWLPPMVGSPGSFNGDFDPTLSPTVTICDLADCAGSVVVTYTMDTGSGSEVVRVVPEDEHYIVNWHTDEFDLDADVTYRISADVDGTELGFADVDVVNSGKELKHVQTGEYVALKDGRTLPIKFGIEDGAIGGGPGGPPGVWVANWSLSQLDIYDENGMNPVLVDTNPGSEMVDLGPDGNFYVGSYLTHNVLRYAPDGTPLGEFIPDSYGSYVEGLTWDRDGNLYVGYYTSGNIVKFDSSGNFVATIATGLGTLRDLIFDADQNLFAALRGSSQVVKITLAGVVTTFADASDGLSGPFGLAIDGDGNLYVSNEFSGAIRKFDSSGNQIGAPFIQHAVNSSKMKFDADGVLWVSSHTAISRFNPDGTPHQDGPFLTGVLPGVSGFAFSTELLDPNWR